MVYIAQIEYIIYHFENQVQLDWHLLLPFAANHAPLWFRIQIRSDPIPTPQTPSRRGHRIDPTKL